MKLMPPEPDITLYEDGFKNKDTLGRNRTGKQLSELLERIEDPIVVALDGSWGSGKSFFLKCWVGAHQHENGGTARTIYFDAFAHDYLDDPLVALIGAIADRFESTNGSSKALDKAKAAAAKLWRPALRIGLATVTAGATEIAGAIVDAGLEAGSKELKAASEHFWKKELGKRAAMDEFRTAISALTEPTKKGGKPNKLVIVVDELDRCRPDYALALLEIIKHFFAAPNVHFVLGVNLSELQNSVRARYGQGVNAELYLQKFVSVTKVLPRHTQQGHGKLIELSYYSNMALEMGLNKALVTEVSNYLERILPNDLLSIRGVQKILTQIALVPQTPHSFGTLVFGNQIIIAGLIVLKIAFPEEYKKAQSNNISITEVAKCFNINTQTSNDPSGSANYIDVVWKATLAPSTLNDTEKEMHQRIFDSWEHNSPTKLIIKTIDEYIEAFDVTV